MITFLILAIGFFIGGVILGARIFGDTHIVEPDKKTLYEAQCYREQEKKKQDEQAEKDRQAKFTQDLKRTLGGGTYSNLDKLVKQATDRGAEHIENDKAHGLLYQLNDAMYVIPKEDKPKKRRRGK